MKTSKNWYPKYESTFTVGTCTCIYNYLNKQQSICLNIMDSGNIWQNIEVHQYDKALIQYDVLHCVVWHFGLVGQ